MVADSYKGANRDGPGMIGYMKREGVIAPIRVLCFS